MTWVKRYIWIPQYKFVSSNQYGTRYKRTGYKRISVAHISCKRTDTDGLKNLILLSDTLDVPVRYDFEDQEAYIEVVGNEALKGCIS